MRVDPAKTTLEVQGLNLGLFIGHNILALRDKVPIVTPKTKPASFAVQKYLDNNAHRIEENCVLGIFAVRDTWRNNTGGRVHLFVGLVGPIGECFEPEVLQEPIDYELKHKFFTSAVSSVSGNARPDVGHIHCHPRLCKKGYFGVNELLAFIRTEHGYQNDVQQLANSNIYRLDFNHGRRPSWVQADASDIVRRFSSKEHVLQMSSRQKHR